MYHKRTFLLCFIGTVATAVAWYVLFIYAPSSKGIPSGGGTVDVPWGSVEGILRSGQVTGAGQTHSLHVYLYLKDGTTVRSQEPSVDDIYDVVRKCGDLCRAILIETE